MTVGDVQFSLLCDACGRAQFRGEVIEEATTEEGAVRQVKHIQRRLWAARVLTRTPLPCSDPSAFPLVCSRKCLDAIRQKHPLTPAHKRGAFDMRSGGDFVFDGRDVLLVVVRPAMPDEPQDGWFE